MKSSASVRKKEAMAGANVAKRRRQALDRKAKPSQDHPKGAAPTESVETTSKATAIVAVAVLAVAFTWSYWPTLVRLVRSWEREPDYSHGYLVVPIALFFLWSRRHTFPEQLRRSLLPGTLLMAASVGVRYFAAIIHADAIDAWSMLLFLAGAVWLFGGFRLLVWGMPSIAFLFFMIPMPYRAETWLSQPLQRVATKISCWALQCLGQPAITKGNTILIDAYQIEIARACSGLRIFMGIIALAFVYLVLIRRSWWERMLLILSILPIALIANATRIVVTALLFQYTTGELAHRFSHDFAGWVMIPFAAALFGLFLWYIDKLIRQVDQVDVSAVIGRDRPASQ